MLEVMDRVTNRSKHEDVITIVKRIAIKMGIISKSHTQEQKLKDIIVSSFQVSVVFDAIVTMGYSMLPCTSGYLMWMVPI